MYQIDNATAVTTAPATPAVGPNPGGHFTSGNPGSSPPVPATTVDAYWLETVQDELGNLVTGAGLAQAKGNTSQVLEAVAIIGNRIATFTSSGSLTVPAGVTTIRVTCTGGGGGGANCASAFPPSASSDSSGGGGGAGGTAIGVFSVTPGQVIPITVGAGGAAQATGGTSSIGSLCSASGGGGTQFQATGTSAGAAGGTATGGAISVIGGYGSDGQSGVVTMAGNGGASYWGGGVRAYAVSGSPLASYAAPGGGGGGAYNGTGTGCSGVNGIVVIEY
jgi:hypothetical protein